MNIRKVVETDEKNTQAFGSIIAGCARYEVGRNTMRRIAEDAGAVVRIGRLYRIDFAKVDMYLRSISQ